MKRIETRTDFGTLMRLAGAVGDAKKAGDPERLAEAQKAHDEYRDLCLESDSMSLGMTIGALDR